MKLRQIFDNRISCLIIDINIENFSLTYILITKKFSIIDINYRLITSLIKGGVSVIFFLKKFILALLLFSNNFLLGLNTEFISYQSNQIH